jgi:hypothetical protein
LRDCHGRRFEFAGRAEDEAIGGQRLIRWWVWRRGVQSTADEVAGEQLPDSFFKNPERNLDDESLMHR